MNAAVTAWLADIATRYRTFESSLPTDWPYSRDTTYGMFVARSLADATCPGAAVAREWVDRVVAGMEP